MDNYYKLGNKHGTLPRFYTKNQFDVCPLPLISLDEMICVPKSLREIASQMTGTDGQRCKRCSCKSGYDYNRCKCKSIKHFYIIPSVMEACHVKINNSICFSYFK